MLTTAGGEPAAQLLDGFHPAQLRLRGYFRRRGFRRLGRSPYYALPFNLVTPGADELLTPGG